MTAPDREVSVLPHELLRVLAGHTVRVRDDIVLRLFTAEEFQAVQHAAVADTGVGQQISIARAVELTRPLELGGTS